jgi:hypothetical protein
MITTYSKKTSIENLPFPIDFKYYCKNGVLYFELTKAESLPVGYAITLVLYETTGSTCWSSIIIVSLWAIGSLILLSIGIVGEYYMFVYGNKLFWGTIYCIQAKRK